MAASPSNRRMSPYISIIFLFICLSPERCNSWGTYGSYSGSMYSGSTYSGTWGTSSSWSSDSGTSSYSSSSSSWYPTSSDTALPEGYTSTSSTAETFTSFGTGEDTEAVELVVSPSMSSSSTVPAHLLESVVRDPTFYYVTSPNFGTLYMAKGRAISPSEARISNNRPKMCHCKMDCWSAPWCMAVSGKENSEGTFDCLYSDHLPKEIGMTTPDAEAIYILFKDRINVKLEIYKKTDRREMYLISTETLLYPNAKAYCHSFPGFRLAVFINKEETDTMLTLHEKIGKAELYMGLIRNEAGTFWDDGDGKPYGESYSSVGLGIPLISDHPVTDRPYFRFRYNNGEDTFDDAKPESMYKFVCQGYIF